jgi:hypothetical protein
MRQPSDLIPEPIFLVGSERSGSTLQRIMLDAHPQIAFLFEFEYSVEKIQDPQGWPNLDEYYDYLDTNLLFPGASLTIDKSLDYPHLVDSFLRQKRDRDGKPFVGATVHYDFDRLLRIWPDARFIHLVRDGRDVARSVIEMGWCGNMYTAVEYWIRAEKLWSNLCQRLPAERRTDVRYEELVREPEATLTRLCEFLGVTYDPLMLDYPKHSTYRPPQPQLIGQWKSKLSSKAVQLAEARIGPMLVERGYELSGYPPLTVSRRMEKQLRLQSRWRCAMFRRKRYGTTMFLADLMARRLGPGHWQGRIQKRLNIIDMQHIK